MTSFSHHSLTLPILISSFTKPNFLSIAAFSNHRHVKRSFAFTSPSFSSSTTTARFSTPFDASLYDNLDDDDDVDESNPFTSNLNPLAASPDTKLVLGLNKYSHDTTLCAADAETGEVLFAMAKERLSRKKHDGGNVASLVDTCLDQLELDIGSIQKVVVNNHHHRVLPMERNLGAMEWEEGLGINGGTEGGYTDEENLLSKAERWEMSHHLAHAYSAAAQCPFDTGLVVVMDGMGETYRTMRNAKDSDGVDRYVSDLDFEGDFECIPSDIQERSTRSVYDWREGESAYEFTKNSDGISVKPIFKRFVEEKTPPALYNHGFENMESAGALYSRASSHIFGDWNACGKVMGLAPWMGHTWTVDDEAETTTITAEVKDSPIMKGKLYEEDENGFQTDPSYMMGIPHISRNDPDLFDENGDMIRKRRYDFDDNDIEEIIEDEDNDDEDDDSESTTTTIIKKKQLPTKVALDAISLSSRIQNDLESVVMDFVQYCKSKSNKQNLCLAGGVALNSVLNGRLSRELGFKNVFIPPYPGDDGIAVGCCAYGLYGNTASRKGRGDAADDDVEEETKSIPTLWTKPLSPYLGPLYSDAMIKNAIDAAAPWLEVQTVSDDQKRLDIMAKEIESGGVIAWYQGRSELGPRALGHRSILADPRQKGLVRFINASVKKRESFRPFAPSVLAEEAGNWFHLNGGDDNDGLEDTTNISPYMSMTAIVKESKQSAIPAVTHVDGSSRLQTVTEEAEPLYHQFLSTFFKNTGVPMVLNTSFNTLPGEPIVETPKDAIRSFLCSMGSIELLVMGDYVIQRKDANVRKLLGEAVNNKGMIIPPSFPKRAGPVEYESKFTIGDNGGDDSIQTKTRVRMPDRPMHNEKDGGWFELLDDLEGELLGVCDGTVGVNEITSQYLQAASDGEDDERTEEKEFQEVLFSNIVRRLIRLYEHSFISW